MTNLEEAPPSLSVSHHQNQVFQLGCASIGVAATSKMRNRIEIGGGDINGVAATLKIVKIVFKSVSPPLQIYQKSVFGSGGAAAKRCLRHSEFKIQFTTWLRYHWCRSHLQLFENRQKVKSLKFCGDSESVVGSAPSAL